MNRRQFIRGAFGLAVSIALPSLPAQKESEWVGCGIPADKIKYFELHKYDCHREHQFLSQYIDSSNSLISHIEKISGQKFIFIVSDEV